MYPPLFNTLKDVAAVKAVLGTSIRVYPFGDAPAKASPQYGVPYAVHQIAVGSPENYLGQTPDYDGFTTQIDTYGATQASADNAAEVIRDALETVAYVVRYGPQGRDPDTGLYRYGFDVDWLTPRA